MLTISPYFSKSIIWDSAKNYYLNTHIQLSHDIAFEKGIRISTYAADLIAYKRLRSFNTNLITRLPKFTLTRIANVLKQYYFLTWLYTRNVFQTKAANALKQYYILTRICTRNAFQTKAWSLLFEGILIFNIITFETKLQVGGSSWCIHQQKKC